MQILVLILLAVSIVAYLAALFLLLLKRSLPEEVAPPRVVLVALGLSAAKSIFGSSIDSLQAPLTGLIVLSCAYAIMNILRTVIGARGLASFDRTVIDRWAVVLIPPIASIGLLAIRETLPDPLFTGLLDAFIIVNLIPAAYMLFQIPTLISHRNSLMNP